MLEGVLQTSVERTLDSNSRFAEVSFRDDENTLELDSDDGCKTL